MHEPGAEERVHGRSLLRLSRPSPSSHSRYASLRRATTAHARCPYRNLATPCPSHPLATTQQRRTATATTPLGSTHKATRCSPPLMMAFLKQPEAPLTVDATAHVKARGGRKEKKVSALQLLPLVPLPPPLDQGERTSHTHPACTTQAPSSRAPSLPLQQTQPPSHRSPNHHMDRSTQSLPHGRMWRPRELFLFTPKGVKGVKLPSIYP